VDSPNSRSPASSELKGSTSDIVSRSPLSASSASVPILGQSSKSMLSISAADSPRVSQRDMGVDSPHTGRRDSDAVCAGCNLPIQKGKYLKVNDLRWHQQCFQCFVCKMSLVDGGFKEKEGRAYCKPHYNELFCPRCAGCGEPIVETSFSRALGKNWHKNHFCCQFCKKIIITGYVSDANNMPYCDNQCYQNSQLT